MLRKNIKVKNDKFIFRNLSNPIQINNLCFFNYYE